MPEKQSTKISQHMPSTSLKFVLKLRNIKPEVLWGWIIAFFLIMLVVIPVITMIHESLIFDANGPRMVSGAEEGQFTLYNWARTVKGELANSLLYKPALNSLSVAIGMTAIALIFGSLFAWLVMRTNVPHKGFFSTVLIIPYIMPSWTIAMAWIAVFKSEQFGGVPGFLNSVFGINPPEWIIYGYIPMIISLGVHYIPYFFIMMSGALANIDSRLEESAELVNASKWEILWKITLPMVLPGIGAGFILTFSKGLGEFGTQAFLGLPVRFYTFSTRIYSALNNQLYGEGYVLALILILATTVVVIINQKILGTRKRYVTISGKGTVKKELDLGKWKLPMTVLLYSFVAICIIGPLLMLSLQTVMKQEGIYSLHNFTLHYWFGGSDSNFAMGQPGVFRNQTVLDSIKNTVIIASVGALISGIIGVLIGYTIVKQRKTFLSKAIENLTFTPYLIPGIAFGGIYLTMFAKNIGPIPSLYGTMTLLILVSVVKHLPFASTAGTTAMFQIDPSLEEVAVVHGIGWGTRFGKIILPLAKAGVFSAMLLNFITIMRTLDLVVLLVTPKTAMMTSVLFRYSEQGFVQHADALMLITIGIVLGGHLILTKAGGKIQL
jgi:iron(III) transport system permease protein